MINKFKFKTSYKRFVFFLSANNIFFKTFYKYFYKPRKGTLSYFISEFSKQTKNLFFIQVGANDGIHNDPIHRFIKRDNWKGLLLEPQKDVYEKYLKKLYRKNKNVLALNVALDYQEGHVPIYRISFSKARWATGLTSFIREILEDAVKSGFVEKNAKKEGVRLPVNKEDYIMEEQIQTISSGSLIRKYAVDKIDWLQIDTEGFDYEIIKIFNIEINKPRAIVYEHFHLSEDDKKSCEIFLKNHGYIIKNYGGNTLAVLKPVNTYLSSILKEL